jgi:hypothetical protein
VHQLGNLFKVDGRAGSTGRPAPALGEHTSEVLSSLPPSIHSNAAPGRDQR